MSNLENPFKTIEVDKSSPTDFRIPQLVDLLENLGRFDITNPEMDTSPTSISIRAQEEDPLAIISSANAYKSKELSEDNFGIVEDVDYTSQEIQNARCRKTKE